MPLFQAQLESLVRLHLPTEQYVVVSSGALAVRGIRDSRDLDIVVTESLWNDLVHKHPIARNSNGVRILQLDNTIEVLQPHDSMFGDSIIVPFQTICEHADIFCGIKFIALGHLKMIKQVMGRDKDLRDIELIDQYLSEHPVRS